jgi:tRNA (mo5U34)-methyltransferase
MLKDFEKYCQSTNLSSICTELVDLSTQALGVNNGNIPKWEEAITNIEQFQTGAVHFKQPYIAIDADIDTAKLTLALKKLMPWRKGPYQIGDLNLDSEWRGDLKWDRLKDYIQPLKNKTVLDVGSGNGYFTYLMAMQGANIALGIEPFLLFNYQFKAIKTLINNPPNAYVLPLKLVQIQLTLS